MFKKATKGSCLKRSGSYRSGVTKRPIFSLPSQQKWPVCTAKRKGEGQWQWKSEKERQIEERELSKWYRQMIRRAIWLWLMLHSLVMHRYFDNRSVCCHSVDSLIGLTLAMETHHISHRCSCETCMISDHISMSYSMLLEWWYELGLYTLNTFFFSILPVV